MQYFFRFKFQIKNKSSVLFIIMFVFNLSGCTILSEPNLGNYPNIGSWQYHQNSKQLVQYTRSAIDQFGQNLLQVTPKDIVYFCPNYVSLNYQQRNQFWSSLISSLAYFESEHSTETKYTEKMLDVNGRPVVSRGLLQISKESANSYDCQINDSEQLHNAKININCAVRILNKWVGTKDKLIARRAGFFTNQWLGAARYWSPFRDNNKLKQIAAETQRLSVCRNEW